MSSQEGPDPRPEQDTPVPSVLFEEWNGIQAVTFTDEREYWAHIQKQNELRRQAWEEKNPEAAAEERKRAEGRNVRHGLGLEGPLQGVEPPWSYLPGGHHPVLLGERLGDRKQYMVIHKLGTGGFGNVWLCHVIDSEPSQYVAVKILMAEYSSEDDRELLYSRRLKELAKTDQTIAEYFLLPLDDFEIEGLNGTHQCFVYPVAGPPVGDVSTVVEDPHGYLRNLSRQAAEAMAALHRHGICHGDFRPRNILLRLEGLNGKSIDEVLEYVGGPVAANIIIHEGANPMAYVPRYIVYPIQFSREVTAELATGKICVIDFGESFDKSNPPPHGVGIPLHYAPPELALERKCGIPSEIYALATTMFEIRFGEKLFEIFGNTVQEYIYLMVEERGQLPEPWWSEWKQKWKEIYEIMDPEADEFEEERDRPEAEERSCAIRMRVSERVSHRIYTPKGIWHEALTTEERDLFEDLLYQMTGHGPETRLSVEEALRHPWFSYGTDNPQVVALVNVEVTESTGIANPALFENDKPKSTTDGKPESDDIDMPQAPENHQHETTRVEKTQLLQDGNPDSVDIEMPQAPAVEHRQPGLNQHGRLQPSDIEKPLGSAQVNKCSSVDNRQWVEVDGPLSMLELNMVQYGIFTVSAWLRRTVGRAFITVLG
ncbi:kinase-like domain-containing protein [Aspergillus varians]